jgi:hypothetical protein
VVSVIPLYRYSPKDKKIISNYHKNIFMNSLHALCGYSGKKSCVAECSNSSDRIMACYRHKDGSGVCIAKDDCPDKNDHDCLSKCIDGAGCFEDKTCKDPNLSSSSLNSPEECKKNCIQSLDGCFKTCGVRNCDIACDKLFSKDGDREERNNYNSFDDPGKKHNHHNPNSKDRDREERNNYNSFDDPGKKHNHHNPNSKDRKGEDWSNDDLFDNPKKT